MPLLAMVIGLLLPALLIVGGLVVLLFREPSTFVTLAAYAAVLYGALYAGMRLSEHPKMGSYVRFIVGAVFVAGFITYCSSHSGDKGCSPTRYIDC